MTQSTPSEQDRLSLVEAQVQTLAQAVRALAEGLEANPSQETEGSAQAARRTARS
ncbi:MULTISPECIES: hypothetical protein [unclassified Streptomyces]|uniref:hypothetical protein n=1 Tax=unclassified Streptomyces TaxID=2593676 RepID=UPI002E140B80|nr:MULTISPECIES: hypothetical protein [unclassified Streptomyces]WSR22812.1 hypothetical protein OG573_29225 [Streptomyces sp. NBC_01205]